MPIPNKLGERTLLEDVAVIRSLLALNEVPDGYTIGLGAAKGRLEFHDETIDTLDVEDAILNHSVIQHSFDLLSGTVLPANQLFSISFRRNTTGPGSGTHYFKIIEIDANAAYSGVAVTGWYTAGSSYRYNNNCNALLDLGVIAIADPTTGATVRYSKLWNHNAAYFKVLRDTQGDGHDKLAVYFVMGEWHRGCQAHFTVAASNSTSFPTTVWQEGNDMGAGVTPPGTEITAT